MIFLGESWEDVCQRAPILRAPDISTLQELYFSKKRRKRSADWEYEDDGDEWGDFDNSDWEDPNFDIESLDGNFEDIGEHYNVNAYPEKYCKVRHVPGLM